MFRFFSMLLPLAFVGCAPTSHSSPQVTVTPDASPQATVAPDGFVIRTDRDEYLAKPEKTTDKLRSYGFILTAQFENRSQEPVYLQRCHPDSPHPIFAILMASESKEQSSAYSPIWACVGHNDKIIVRPGETRTDQFPISGPTSWENGGGINFGAMEGRFRLQYAVTVYREQPSADQSWRRVVSEQLEVKSNVFIIGLKQAAGKR